SHYPIRAPFDGTVLSKDVALLEHARPDMQLLRIADLATVWVTADIYEEHMPLLSWLDGKTVLVRNEAWPDRTFKAEIFASGEIMDEASRTIALRAIADNSEHLLKPGMFVSVELPPIEKSGVLQLPDTAVQEHEGQKFVFLHDHDDVFVRRNVVTGLTGETGIEIKEGINAGDQIVMAGGFVLKSRMLADLMGGE
ncbi:MAG: efflux RND transporter periplasmic adaptor subunit, partial [Pirellulaceae bacterium]|nr:efflux RND transporter periplasmic adaptor subunit [Pirellulaceae bacterium]